MRPCVSAGSQGEFFYLDNILTPISISAGFEAKISVLVSVSVACSLLTLLKFTGKSLRGAQFY